MSNFLDFTDADTWDANVGEVTPPSTFDPTPTNTDYDSSGGAYDPRLDPNIPGGHDPRLDTYGVGPGSASAGNDANGAPTLDDYNRAVSFYGKDFTDKMFQQILKDNPQYASAIAKYLPNVVNAVTNPGGGTTTTPPGGGNPLGTTDPMGLLAAAGLAYQQFHNADQYTKQADQYGKILNPYGAYRDAAAQKLAALQADPSSIQDTPGYKFALQQGLGAVANRDNRSFGVGAGSTNPDMMNFAQGLASKTYNDTIKQYSDQAGVGIGPSAAASIYGLGMQGNIASQSNAVNALMSPFGPGNNTGGNGGGGGIDWSKIASWFGGSVTPPGYTYDPNNDPGKIVNNQQTPSVPVDPNNPDPNLNHVPNDNTGVIPGGT
jgi:hypothetical protein